MQTRPSSVAIAVLAITPLTGCSGGPAPDALPPAATSDAATSDAATSDAATSDAATAARTPTAQQTDASDEERGRITGRVVFVGEEYLPMEVPARRATSDHCKNQPIKHNAIVLAPTADGCTDMCDGRPRPMSDVIVRLPIGAVPASTTPDKPAVITRQNCVSNPRALTMTVSQPLQIVNSDPILHNIAGHSLAPKKMFLNAAQPKGAEPVTHNFTSPGLYRISSDIHDWMHSFVWVSDHPHAVVTDITGNFVLENVPAGTYHLEAWHSFFGLKRIEVTVIPGGRVEKVTVEYDGAELEPPENPGELDSLFE